MQLNDVYFVLCWGCSQFSPCEHCQVSPPRYSTCTAAENSTVPLHQWSDLLQTQHSRTQSSLATV